MINTLKGANIFNLMCPIENKEFACMHFFNSVVNGQITYKQYKF
jgi:hypothetical protein